MRRMGRRRAVQLLAASGTLLLLGQLLVLRVLSGGGACGGAGAEVAAAVGLFLNVTAALPLPVVLLDTRVLSRLDSECPMCVERPVAFGALYRHVRDTHSLLQAQLDAAGFRSALLLNTLPAEPAAPDSVRDAPTAVLVSRDAVVLLLVLLHERAEHAFWWFGAATADFALQHKLIAAGLPSAHPLHVMQQEGALDRYFHSILTDNLPMNSFFCSYIL